MSTYTDNYQLEKPVQSDSGDVSVLNRNSDKIDTIMHASQVSIADAYDENATYNTGDVVMYEFFLYECLDDNVTGTWDATKWQRTTAATSGSSGSAGINYSTTEQDTGLKWIDGSAIYQKTIDFGTMPSDDEKDVAHGISNLAFVVDVEFIVYSSTQGRWRMMPSVSRGNIQAQSLYGVDSQYVWALGGQNADVDSSWTGTVTLRYTKSSS